ncbi:TetR/AcrR family transcriptional regulator [Kordiimonas aquimaris]|uniref:TetR/AcrR family transcriptional regulator n=1 Tax=Kordiimonas aquimaris TaxID=707591 RepID=UPI0021CFDF19|nr:TetR/AcrR family transcriptional regulator [Kordiimonas aquimaris]
MTAVKKRVRRTPDEARTLILDAARQRLAADGPEGLQLTEIAAVAGMAHSTVLHHFGSVEGLRAALAEKMVEKLLSDILAVLDATGGSVPTDHTILFRVFEVLSDDGNARLLAWTMLKGGELDAGRETITRLFAELSAGIAAAIMRNNVGATEAKAKREARFIIHLAALTAVGDGVAGSYLSDLIGLADHEAKSEFRDWFAKRLIV